MFVERYRRSPSKQSRNAVALAFVAIGATFMFPSASTADEISLRELVLVPAASGSDHSQSQFGPGVGDLVAITEDEFAREVALTRADELAAPSAATRSANSTSQALLTSPAFGRSNAWVWLLIVGLLIIAAAFRALERRRE